MEKSNAKVSAKGWIVIPASLRRKYGIKPGSIIKIGEENNKIVLEPERENPVEECFGKYANKASLTKALLRERDEEKKREEKKSLRF